MFDVEKYEQIKKGYRLLSIIDLWLVFTSFMFVYTLFLGSGFSMIYLLLISIALVLKYWIKSKITKIENEEK